MSRCVLFKIRPSRPILKTSYHRLQPWLQWRKCPPGLFAMKEQWTYVSTYTCIYTVIFCYSCPAICAMKGCAEIMNAILLSLLCKLFMLKL